MSEHTDTPTTAPIQPRIDGLMVLIRRSTWLVRMTLLATGLTALVAGAYYLFQPVRWTAWVEFRPVFQGADLGQYPNETKFGPGDVTDSLVIDQVYDKDKISQYCTREAFRVGFVVQKTSVELEYLSGYYTDLLSDPRISGVERQRLQDEYLQRRASAPIHYRLAYVRTPECQRLPPSVGTQTLDDVLAQWASDADLKRGVLKLRLPVMGPTVFNRDPGTSPSLLVEADGLRGSVQVVLENIRRILVAPGADLVRLGEGENRFGFSEVQAKLESMLNVELNPLIVAAGRGVGGESRQWVEHALFTATANYEAAAKQADTYRIALQLYSGGDPGSVTPEASSPARPPASADRASAYEMDRTFIDKIVEMSPQHGPFRQQTTTSMVNSLLITSILSANVEHYKSLLAAMQASGGAVMTQAEIRKRLDAITEQAKAHTRDFNALYEEFSKMSLRAGDQMYEISGGTVTESAGSMSRRGYITLVLGVLISTPALLGAWILLSARLGRRPTDA